MFAALPKNSTCFEDLRPELYDVPNFTTLYGSADYYSVHYSHTFPHLRTLILSNFLTIPVKDIHQVLETWLSIFATEFDGPGTRRLLIQVIGEK